MGSIVIINIAKGFLENKVETLAINISLLSQFLFYGLGRLFNILGNKF